MRCEDYFLIIISLFKDEMRRERDEEISIEPASSPGLATAQIGGGQTGGAALIGPPPVS